VRQGWAPTVSQQTDAPAAQTNDPDWRKQLFGQ
jgi:hypothetical protein